MRLIKIVMKDVFLLLLLSLSFSCVQENADIIYRGDNPRKNRSNSLKPSYMKGSYVEDGSRGLVRDLRKDYSDESDTAGDRSAGDKTCGDFVIVGDSDSLLRIARKCGCTLTNIASINNIKPPYNVYIGQKIKTNCGNKSSKDTSSRSEVTYKTVVVEKGSSLIRIAIDNNSTIRELAAINSIDPPYNVYVGQKIKVPVKNGVIKSDNYNNYRGSSGKNNNITNDDISISNGMYTVKKGDNVYNISTRTNTNFTELIKINDLKKPYGIYVGQKLKIPGYSSTNINTDNTNKTNVEADISSNKLEKVEEKNELLAGGKNNFIGSNTGESGFMWPVKGELIKKFGKQDDGSFNDAINIKSAQGTKIQAADWGEVAYAGNELKGFGNIVIIKHKNGWLTVYGYCDSINVKVKDRVEKGQVIAFVGKTGNVSEPQLYFSLRKGRTAMDPLKYLTNN